MSSETRETISQLLLQLSRLNELNDSELSAGFFCFLLNSVNSLKDIQNIKTKPFHYTVFQAAVNYTIDHSGKAARGDVIVESYPMKWIIQQFPDQGSVCHANDWLPLHWCAALSDSTGVINESHLHGLLREDPSLALISDKYEVSPFSLAIAKYNPSISFVEAMIAVDERVVKTPDRDGAYGLMYAGAWNENTELLERLYNLYPKAVNETDAYGFLPIHFACYAGTVESVQFLLLKHSKGAKIKNRAGVLPLLACAANARRGGVEMARILLEIYPEAISVPDDEGSLPLHIAAQFSSFDVIRFLYAIYPSAASTPNAEGLLPMHFAGLRKEKSIEIVDFLTDANTDDEAAKFIPSVGGKTEDCVLS